MIENSIPIFVAKGFWWALGLAVSSISTLFGLHVRNDMVFRKDTKKTIDGLSERIGKQEVAAAKTGTHIVYLRESSDSMNGKLDKLLEAAIENNK